MNGGKAKDEDLSDDVTRPRRTDRQGYQVHPNHMQGTFHMYNGKNMYVSSATQPKKNPLYKDTSRQKERYYTGGHSIGVDRTDKQNGKARKTRSYPRSDYGHQNYAMSGFNQSTPRSTYSTPMPGYMYSTQSYGQQQMRAKPNSNPWNPRETGYSYPSNRYKGHLDAYF